MNELKNKVDRRLKNINLLFDIAEILCRNKAISVEEVRDLVMSEIVKLANLYKEIEEGGEK